EAMACGTPVVATSKAVSALDILQGEDVMVADDVQQLARAVLQLLSSRDLQKKIGDTGRRYVEKHHSWKSIAEKLEAVYWEAVIKKRGKYL
ncbi:MAG: glycosyltransferase family 4 protein, partial [Chloroflexi bacterium]|nr:glycosyltransferase family 4 protein [Chloroflexota bacterium]